MPLALMNGRWHWLPNPLTVSVCFSLLFECLVIYLGAYYVGLIPNTIFLFRAH